MRILITGAKGNFPSVLIPRLEAAGHELVLLDLEPMKSARGRTVQADIRDAGAVTAAMAGCDAVVHAMAYHGDMSSRRNHDDYYHVNITGTQNVLQAMRRWKIKVLVFSSSEVVYGSGMRGRLTMDESVPCEPDWIYPLTKVLCEQMCGFYSRTEGMRVAMLLYGCFVPADWKVQGMGRLNNWLDREDVAQANHRALDALAAGKFECETFLIHCSKPFVEADWPALAQTPETVIERYWPGSVALLKRHGLQVGPIGRRFDISKARRLLGYEPEHNFEQFLARLSATAT
jgi:nucleoside-diphosphate-sugar epimerase